MKPVGWKKRVVREVVEQVTVLVFLAPFLISFAIFENTCLNNTGNRTFHTAKHFGQRY